MELSAWSSTIWTAGQSGNQKGNIAHEPAAPRLLSLKATQNFTVTLHLRSPGYQDPNTQGYHRPASRGLILTDSILKHKSMFTEGGTWRDEHRVFVICWQIELQLKKKKKKSVFIAKWWRLTCRQNRAQGITAGGNACSCSEQENQGFGKSW